mmetsp:Transcript_13369/g.37904  ORF Transcript_13369/g.37904 Transcript_13369/m.37904 type:complete len:404 (+) Transcript_13369:84-1295(+)
MKQDSMSPDGCAKFTLLRRRHFVPVEGTRSCTLDIFRVNTGLVAGTAARVRYFEEASNGEVPEVWRKPVTLRLPKDDEAYITKFIERFAEQKLSSGYTSCTSKNRDAAVPCRVAAEEAQLDTCASETPQAAEKCNAAFEAAGKSYMQDINETGDVDHTSQAGIEPPKSCVKKDIPIENVARFFHLPIHLAADALKVGETWLKQKCREHGIKRWPYRKVKSLDKSIEKVVAAISDCKDPKQLAALQKQADDLRAHRQQCYFISSSSVPAGGAPSYAQDEAAPDETTPPPVNPAPHVDIPSSASPSPGGCLPGPMSAGSKRRSPESINVMSSSPKLMRTLSKALQEDGLEAKLSSASSVLPPLSICFDSPTALKAIKCPAVSCAAAESRGYSSPVCSPGLQRILT